MLGNDETNRVGLASAGMPQMGAGVVTGEHQHGAWTRQCDRETQAMGSKRSNGLSHGGCCRGLQEVRDRLLWRCVVKRAGGALLAWPLDRFSALAAPAQGPRAREGSARARAQTLALRIECRPARVGARCQGRAITNDGRGGIGAQAQRQGGGGLRWTCYVVRLKASQRRRQPLAPALGLELATGPRQPISALPRTARSHSAPGISTSRLHPFGSGGPQEPPGTPLDRASSCTRRFGVGRLPRHATKRVVTE
jgi:hypothetical protein